MHRRLLSIFLILSVGVTVSGLSGVVFAEPPAGTEVLVLVSIDGEAGLVKFAGTALPLYARLQADAGTWLLAGADSPGLIELDFAGLSYQILDLISRGGSYYLAYPMPGRISIQWRDYGRILLDLQSMVLLRTTPAQAERLAEAGAEIQALHLTPKPVLVPGKPPLAPESIVPNPFIEALLSQVDETRVYSYTGGLSGEWPVSVGGQAFTIFTRNTYSGEPVNKATQYVGEHLQGLGLNVEYHSWNADRPPNVIGERTGTVNPDEIYLITAHLDNMPSSGNAPGADDNASGSVAVLTAADILTQFDWGCTLRFVFFTGEEQGLLGSHAYALRSFNAGEDIQGVLNLDMIAWNTVNSPPRIELHANGTDSGLIAQLFADVVDAYALNLIPDIVTPGISASDHASFWAYGYDAILGIEDYSNDFNPYYHSVNDSLGNLQDLSYYTDFVRAAVGTYAHMAGCMLPVDQGTLAGTITDAVGGLPLAGASVIAAAVQGLPFHSLTNSAATYTQTLPVGVYTVTASAAGYQSAAIGEVGIVSDTVTTLDFTLNPVPCEPVTGTNFTWTPEIPLVGLPTVFTGTNTSQTNLVYAWDFGDGGGGVGITTTHTYTSPGAFTVGLTASSLCADEVLTQTVQVDPSWMTYLPLAGGGDPLAR